MVAITYSPDFIKHITPYMHPEQPARTEVIYRALAPLQLKRLPFEKAALEDVARVHTRPYIELVERECAALKENTIAFLSTGDVTICPESYEIALLAAGSTLKGIDSIMKGECRYCFSICRPPGHHASQDRGMGFCLFNNVAIACRYLQANYPIKRVLIVDWDVHHGNGTQDIFYNDPSVFYFSTHQEGIYPGTGHEEERGVENILNCPIAPGKGSNLAVKEAFKTKLTDAMCSFKPQFIIISAGFDAHRDDPLGGLWLTESDFSELTLLMKELARTYECPGILSVLEGGYNLDALAKSSVAHIKSFLN